LPWGSLSRRDTGVEGSIDLRIGKAAETLDTLVKENKSGAYDFAFIDGDKKIYGVYYEQCLTLVRPGGLILIDNVLWDRRLVNDTDKELVTSTIRILNEKFTTMNVVR
jgi:predicted O-methyltransferase YrrM